MNKVVNYVVVHESAIDVNQTVHEFLMKGWQPYGTLTVSQGSGNVIYAQAMVQYAQKEEGDRE